MNIMTALVNPFFYWLAWIVIPLIVEVIPSIASFFILLWKRRKARARINPPVWPDVVIIVPVYNSQESLERCLRSINDSDYPKQNMYIYLVNNMSSDHSFEAFQRAQEQFGDLRMDWLNSRQGKSRALNLAIYNSNGKYLINIDSDGILERSAITRMVSFLELNEDITCCTGTVLTNPELVEGYKRFLPRLLRRLEFVEYAQAFLAGRSYDAEINSMYTISGAFSAFRMESIANTHLYNTDTISEDTEITFQMRYLLKKRVGICEEAIYFTDPIEDFNKLYTQRQRWQRGSIEVASMYPGIKLVPWRYLRDTNIKALLFDHTFAFPRMIWYLALVFLLIIGYSSEVVLIAMGAIFLFYIVCGYLYFYISQYLLRPFGRTRRYYLSRWADVFLLPFYNFAVFFIRFAGIINSINTRSNWKTDTLTDEWDKFRHTMGSSMAKIEGVLGRIQRAVNYEDKYNEQKE